MGESQQGEKTLQEWEKRWDFNNEKEKNLSALFIMAKELMRGGVSNGETEECIE